MAGAAFFDLDRTLLMGASVTWLTLNVARAISPLRYAYCIVLMLTCATVSSPANTAEESVGVPVSR